MLGGKNAFMKVEEWDIEGGKWLIEKDKAPYRKKKKENLPFVPLPWWTLQAVPTV